MQAVMNEEIDQSERSSAGNRLRLDPSMYDQRFLCELGTAAPVCAWRFLSNGCGKSMLQRCPRSLRLSASSTIRLVTPRATPVSTTTDGRRCSTVHQAARASPAQLTA